MARSSGGRDTTVVDIEVKVKNLRGGWYQRWHVTGTLPGWSIKSIGGRYADEKRSCI